MSSSLCKLGIYIDDVVIHMKFLFYRLYSVTTANQCTSGELEDEAGIHDDNFGLTYPGEDG